MFGTYLARELGKRRKQTAIIAVGLALAVALVMIVSAMAAGVRDAQAQALEAVYGIGTDLTVTRAASAPAEGQAPGMQFDFGANAGAATSEGARTIATSRLEVTRGAAAFDMTAVTTAADLEGVAAAAGSLALLSTTFSGELPTFTERPNDGAMPGGPGGPGGGGFDIGGGADGAGGSSFGIESLTVTGVDAGAAGIGPLTSTTIVEGRALTIADAGSPVAVVDSNYATTAELEVGDTIALGDGTLTIVGVASSTATSGTGSDAYIPLDIAQSLAGLEGQITTVYVQAASADRIDAVAAELAAALPDATVNTQSELASTVSGSLTSASALISNLGIWLSAIVLAAAFVIAILFTVSGVTRRTKEFGTLKAIGWPSSRIVAQVAGESLTTGLIGVVGGVAVGLAGILVVNAIAPTIAVGATQPGFGDAGPMQGPPGGMMPPGAVGPFAQAASSGVTLSAVITPGVILTAVGLALLGAVLAGVIGGWRAARLRPAAALRTVE